MGFIKIGKGSSQQVGGDGDGWAIASPFYWYRHTDNWKITGLNNSNSPESYNRRIYIRVYLNAGTNYQIGTSSDFDGKIWLYNTDGSEITSADDSSYEVNGEYFSDIIDYTPSTSGVYIIGAGAYSDGQGDMTVCCYPAPEQEETPESTTVYETSSGFNSIGKPISYRSASGAGIEYSTYLVPKDALLSNCDSLTDNMLNFTNCEVSTDTKKFGKGSIKINDGGYIKFEHDLDLLNTAWAVGHFFYLDNYASGDDWKPLINNDDDQAGTFLIGISSSGYLKWHVRANGSANITQLTSGWHHLRVTHIESDKLRVYLDGVFITEFSGFSRANNTMWIGRFGYGGSYQFNGYIDSIECFEIPSDKLANYSGETAPVPSNKFNGV